MNRGRRLVASLFLELPGCPIERRRQIACVDLEAFSELGQLDEPIHLLGLRQSDPIDQVGKRPA